PFSGSHLMTINAIKGLVPVLWAIYISLQQWNKVHNPLPFHRGRSELTPNAVAILIWVDFGSWSLKKASYEVGKAKYL
ncbi:hypothetical protein A2U01_0017217, partial [Trifolium medium]|nr:hypothetical protein [Trifolium medium]